MSKYSFLQHQSLTMPKTLNGDPLGKNFPKSLAMPKTERGTLCSRSVLYVTRETFLVQFSGPTGNLKFCRTILVTSGVSKKIYKKTLTKSHDYSRLFSRKASTKMVINQRPLLVNLKLRQKCAETEK